MTSLQKRTREVAVQAGYKVHILNLNHRCKSNNWLKQHGAPMRRRPFCQNSKLSTMDEGYLFW